MTNCGQIFYHMSDAEKKEFGENVDINTIGSHEKMKAIVLQDILFHHLSRTRTHVSSHTHTRNTAHACHTTALYRP